MIEVRFTPLATSAILDQEDWYRSEANELVALRWTQAVFDQVASLRRFPERGARCSGMRVSLRQLRKSQVPGFPFNIFYRVDQVRAVLLVIHVLHGKRDVEALLSRASRTF